MNQARTVIPGTSKPRAWSKMNKFDYILLFSCVLLLLAFFINFFVFQGRTWKWDTLFPYIFYMDNNNEIALGMLSKGFLLTLRLGVWAFIFAFVFGLSVGMYTANKRGLVVLPFTFFVQTLRNIPPLIFIFLIYFFSGQFFLPLIFSLQDFAYSLSPQTLSWFSYIFAPPMQIEGMTAAIVALGLYEGVYIAEIVRASIESISKHQSESAKALGFSPFQSLRYILLPQAKRVMLPPLAGQTISIFKDSALAALVSLPELTFQSLEIMTVTRMTLEIWIVCMFLYFCLSKICSIIYNYLEKKITWKPLS